MIEPAKLVDWGGCADFAGVVSGARSLTVAAPIIGCHLTRSLTVAALIDRGADRSRLCLKCGMLFGISAGRSGMR